MLKIEAKSIRDARQDIVRIQKVIWDHLLASKGEIIQRQALFSLPFRTLNNSLGFLEWLATLTEEDSKM